MGKWEVVSRRSSGKPLRVSKDFPGKGLGSIAIMDYEEYSWYMYIDPGDLG